MLIDRGRGQGGNRCKANPALARGIMLLAGQMAIRGTGGQATNGTGRVHPFNPHAGQPSQATIQHACTEHAVQCESQESKALRMPAHKAHSRDSIFNSLPNEALTSHMSSPEVGKTVHGSSNGGSSRRRRGVGFSLPLDDRPRENGVRGGVHDAPLHSHAVTELSDGDESVILEADEVPPSPSV